MDRRCILDFSSSGRQNEALAERGCRGSLRMLELERWHARARDCAATLSPVCWHGNSALKVRVGAVAGRLLVESAQSCEFRRGRDSRHAERSASVVQALCVHVHADAMLVCVVNDSAHARLCPWNVTVNAARASGRALQPGLLVPVAE
jgi:hypothetical protein